MSSQQPQGRLPVEIRCANQQLRPGAFVLALVECEQLGLQRTLLVLDTNTGTVHLEAECGCTVGQHLSQMVMELARLLALKHANPAAGNTTH